MGSAFAALEAESGIGLSLCWGIAPGARAIRKSILFALNFRFADQELPWISLPETRFWSSRSVFSTALTSDVSLTLAKLNEAASKYA